MEENLVGNDDLISFTRIKVNDGVGGFLFEGFFPGKVKLIATIFAKHLIFSCAVSDEVISWGPLYFLAFLAFICDCKRKIDVD